MKIIVKIFLCCLCALLILVAAAFFYIRSIKWEDRIGHYASQSLGRDLKIDSLHFKFFPVRVEIDGLHLANATWGDTPDMIRIQRLAAQINPVAFFHGLLRYRYLTVDGLDVVLERDKNGIGNWKFSSQPSKDGGSPALIPKNRGEFPSLLDATVHDGRVRMRTSSGAWLNMSLRALQVQAASDHAPVHLTLSGAYNDVPVTVDAQLHSFRELRDRAKPFGMDLTFATTRGRLHFNGTMTEPLDVEGIDGPIEFHAPDLDEVLALGGVQRHVPLALDIAGPLQKKKDDWRLVIVHGGLNNQAFAGKLLFHEGARRQADATIFNLHFPALDAQPLLAALAQKTKAKSASLSLRPPPDPSSTLDARLSADRFNFGHLNFQHAALHAALTPGNFDLQTAQADFADGTIMLSGASSAAGATAMLRLAATGNHLNFCQTLHAFGTPCTFLEGDLDLQAAAIATGADVATALKHNQGTLTATMQNGVMPRALLEKLSEDLRSLARHADGDVPVTCLRADATLKNGIAAIRPLILQTPRGSIYGGGWLDLPTRQQNIIVGSDPHSTSGWALDVPLRITGSLDQPSVLPAGRSSLAPYLNVRGEGC